MEVLIWGAIFLATFLMMEFMAWFTHKYIMHGFLWSLHKDHHKKDHNSWWERNDFFFIFYAAVSMYFFMGDVNYGIPIGAGIAAYGLTYFLVHDIFIHQRFKIFKKADGWYAKAIRRAHKMHHKHLGKGEGESFGMLVPPLKYFKKYKS